VVAFAGIWMRLGGSGGQVGVRKIRARRFGGIARWHLVGLGAGGSAAGYRGGVQRGGGSWRLFVGVGRVMLCNCAKVVIVG